MPIPPTAAAHRRPLATAVVAAGALFAVAFLPSADTSPDVNSTGTTHHVRTATDNGPVTHARSASDASDSSAASDPGSDPGSGSGSGRDHGSTEQWTDAAAGETEEGSGGVPTSVLVGTAAGAVGLTGLLAVRAGRRGAA
ncbi:hypothetical protein [Streptomyces sp. NPDC054784]